MPITVTCSRCGHREKCDDRDARQSIECDSCGKRIRVPEKAQPAYSANAVATFAVVGVVGLAMLIGGFSIFYFALRNLPHRPIAMEPFPEPPRDQWVEEVPVQPPPNKPKIDIEPQIDIEPKRPDIYAPEKKIPAIEMPIAEGKPSADPGERIVNGDFEQGRAGFRTQYKYSPGNVGPALAYDVLQRPKDAHRDAAAFGDHTTGSGRMLMVNGGSAAHQVVWGQTVAVRPGADYSFSLWVASWSNISPAMLEVRVNGKAIGEIVAPQNAGQWKELRVSWSAREATTAVVEIFDMNNEVSGNDFAIDDISLRGPAPE